MAAKQLIAIAIHSCDVMFCVLSLDYYIRIPSSSLPPVYSVLPLVFPVSCVHSFLFCPHQTLPVEKVAVLCRFLDIGAVTKNHLLKYSLAHAFCCFLASVEDVNPAVATRARLLLDTIKRPALQVTLHPILSFQNSRVSKALS